MASALKVKVKWNKEVYDVELDLSEEPEVFKAQLFALTGVTPERQKVVCKGAILKDSWASLKLKDGATILLMGTREELPQAPIEKTVFVEDMDDVELASALKLPPGMANLGNTCYLNAVVQCLKTVPELMDGLSKFNVPPSAPKQDADTITSTFRDIYKTMDQPASFAPLIFLESLRQVFPRFAEKNGGGNHVQQDANECWTEIIRMLQQRLKPVPNVGLGDVPVDSPEAIAATKQHKSLINQLFGGQLEVTLKCDENDLECETQSTEEFLQLSCFINIEVKYLIAGLKLRMQDTISKMSPTLNRDALYKKTLKISRLPAYLTVSFVRFFYKERESINAKVLKDVKFPMMLDVYELCNKDLQQKLVAQRDKFKIWDDEQVEKKVRGEKKAEVDINKNIPFSFSDDPGSNNSGYYQLQGVLTHKGRSSSSGHYVAWIRRDHKEWFKCDDETVSVVHEDDILKLSGGGDWHVAYILLYGPRLLGVE